MWFVFGLLTLAAAVGFQWYWRWHRHWDGQWSHHAGIACEQQDEEVKGVLRGRKVALIVPDVYRFELKRETAVDRFFKWTGLAVEKEFGHSGLDRLVYLASNDDHLIDRMTASERMQQVAQELFGIDLNGCRLRDVHCAKGQLWMRLDVKGIQDNSDAAFKLDQACARLLPVLKELADELGRHVPASPAESRDRFLWPSVALLALSSGLFWNTWVSVVRSGWLDHTIVLDNSALWWRSAFTGAVVLGMLVGLVLWRLAGSARVHLVLMEVLLVGGIGSVGTGYLELRDLNREWDTSVPQLLEVPVQRKSISKGRRSTTYYLHVPDWTGQDTERRVSVSRSFYDSTNPTHMLVFEQRAGYLGVRWAELTGRKP